MIAKGIFIYRFISISLGILLLFARQELFAHEDRSFISMQSIGSQSDPYPLHAKGLVVLGSSQPLLEEETLEDVDGIWTIGYQFPGDKKKILAQLSTLLNSGPLTPETVDQIKQTITQHYDTNGYPLVLVYVPNQEISQGVLQIVVEESTVGEIFIQGEQWTSAKRLKSYLDLKSHDSIDEFDLFKSLNFMNKNPFRRVDLIYSPGKEEGTTDITLAVKDRRPFRVYAGSDNTGVKPTDEIRWFSGFNWGNAFGLDHILSYQYTASYDLHRFQAHTAQYIIPLPWKNRINIYGGYNEVVPKITHPIMRNTGWGMQASLRYEIPFMVRRFLEQEIDFGGDFKRTNNTFAFTDETPHFGKNVNLTQLVLTYSGTYEKNTYRLDFEGDLYCSPCQWVPDQTEKDYQSLRPGTQPTWVYFRGAFNYLQRIAGASFALTARGQGSNKALLPSEQFGLGGYDTVRGYDERVVNKDNAVVINAEFRSPAIPVFKNISHKCSDAFQLLAFIDAAWGIDHVINPPDSLSDYLIGVGPGIRYTWEPYITGRLDLGIKLHKNEIIGHANSRIHFSLIVSY